MRPITTYPAQVGNFVDPSDPLFAVWRRIRTKNRSTLPQWRSTTPASTACPLSIWYWRNNSTTSHGKSVRLSRDRHAGLAWAQFGSREGTNIDFFLRSGGGTHRAKVRFMRFRFPLHAFGLILGSMAFFGCNGNITTDTDPDGDGCKDPKPEVAEGTWCPPSWVCSEGEWVDSSGACPDPECPASKPVNGQDCPLVGQSCPYEEDVPCGETEIVNVMCTQNGWSVGANFCQPEPICPSLLPSIGTACDDWADAYFCNFAVETWCGPQDVIVSCVFEAQAWVWTLQQPATCEICKGYTEPGTCAVSAGCQWLTPGCGDQPIQEGCYPKEGCDVNPCMTDDSICAEVTFNPCAGSNCNACGASFFACLPSWAP